VDALRAVCRDTTPLKEAVDESQQRCEGLQNV
jgi:hypothetical protein